MLIESHQDQMTEGGINWIHLQKQNKIFVSKYSFKLSKKNPEYRNPIGESYA